MRRQNFQLLKVNDVDVGKLADFQRASVMKAVQRCGALGEHLHSILQLDKPAIADPLGQ